jgi:glycosyltransferase involved in cell wall biosynthesis
MISLIIPCYNCAAFIDAQVEKLLAFLSAHFDQFEIILVDDGSGDATPKHLRTWAVRDSRVRACIFERNQGKGAAVKEGVLKSRGDFVLFTDVDFPYGLSAITEFVTHLQSGQDVILGVRRDDWEVNGQKMHRTLLSRLFVRCANLALREKVPDTQAGIKGFRKEAARRIFEQVSIPGFGFDVEAIAIAQKYNMKIMNVSVKLVNQAPSTVQVGRDGLRMCLDIAYVFFKYRI